MTTYFCYSDDSGADEARTVTGLLIPAEHWVDLMGQWRAARALLTAKFAVTEHAELHAVELVKGRGSYCGGDRVAEGRFDKPSRLQAFDLVLGHLAQTPGLVVSTVGAGTRRQADVYGHFLNHLDGWAQANDSHVSVSYDGKSGFLDTDARPDELQAAMEDVWRDQRPYRHHHRALDPVSRRIIDDPVVRDSRSNPLIQAADLVAYGAFHAWMDAHPEVWPRNSPLLSVCRSYEQLGPLWLPGRELGMTWIDK